jgi:hypothetical protein
MATLKIPLPKPLEFARDDDKIVQIAQQQRMRARQTRERLATCVIALRR